MEPAASPAAPSSRLPALLSLLGFAAAVLGLAALFLSHHLVCRNPLVIAVQVMAVLLMLWARVTFGMRSFHAAATPTAGGLVTNGPYGLWRHPIYAAILWFVWAGALCQPAVVGMAGAAVISAGLALRMTIEERLLRRTYPEYEAYAARTRRVIPYLL
jgi:protein-S-isoprenylcysteine O-methyltransferase Ste14